MFNGIVSSTEVYAYFNPNMRDEQHIKSLRVVEAFIALNLFV